MRFRVLTGLLAIGANTAIFIPGSNIVVQIYHCVTPFTYDWLKEHSVQAVALRSAVMKQQAKNCFSYGCNPC